MKKALAKSITKNISISTIRTIIRITTAIKDMKIALAVIAKELQVQVSNMEVETSLIIIVALVELVQAGFQEVTSCRVVE
ncbi:unnamed protein product [Leptidea sinapis]|uniref:Uncharacterized protein n=1 Tax=Leptidea sinapis TaxID=189913 RepID=A0A5E4QC35_9NEOP|nr:unnamed protein product [Leptidea sinapis]